jgi:hypothetical protein
MEWFDSLGAGVAAVLFLDSVFVVWLVQRSRRRILAPRLVADPRFDRRARGA